MQVHVAHADITNLPVDAIVNPANSLGIMDDGVAGAIRLYGGQEIQTEAMRYAPIAVGAAVVTTGGKLPAPRVIHAPTMDKPGMRVAPENIRRAARAALIAAFTQKFKVIAFPGMGTDLGYVPITESVRAIVEEIRAHKREYPETIYLVDESDDVVIAFDDAVRLALQIA
ncbi:MAG TPA: macro domain-containing protein [Kofleriaceae bacterium]|nr:macro domain-containing protein [Kofleriaceae bacterium]